MVSTFCLSRWHELLCLVVEVIVLGIVIVIFVFLDHHYFSELLNVQVPKHKINNTQDKNNDINTKT